MIATFFVSHAWELLGRKYTIFISFFLTTFVYVLFPYTGSKTNNFALLFVVRCLVAIVMAAPISHPLINDYVCRSYRGKAIALNGIGYILGELGAMGLNFATINQKPEVQFIIASIVIGLFSIFFFFAIKDPAMEGLRKKLNKRANIVAGHSAQEIMG
jgi:MFS family permease